MMIDRQMLREALASLVERTAEYIPHALLALLIVAAGWVMGRVVGRLTQRVAVRVGLDRAAEEGGLRSRLEAAGIETSVSRMLGRLLAVVIFLAFCVLAIRELRVDVSALPVAPMLHYLPKVLAAIVLLTVGVYLAGLGGRAVRTAAAGLGVEFHRSLGRATHAALVAVVLVLTIDQLGFNVALLTGLVTSVATIALATVGLTFALGAREVTRNLLAGFYVKETLRAGQRVEIDGAEGTIEAIGAISAEIDLGTHRLLLPNTSLIETAIRIPKGGD